MSDHTARFEKVMADLKAEIDRLAAIEVNIGPLNRVYERLKEQTADITAIEERVDAVRREILSPVQAELSSGRKASHVFGWIGVLGFAYTVTAPLLQDDPLQPLQPQLTSINDAIQDQLTTDQQQQASLSSLQRMTSEVRSRVRSETFTTADMEPVEGQTRFPRGNTVRLFNSEEPVISLQLDDVLTVQPVDNVVGEPVLVASFDVLVQGRRLGQQEIDGRFTTTNDSRELVARLSYRPPDRLLVVNQTAFTVDEVHSFTLEDVRSTGVLGRRSSDSENAAYLSATREAR